MIPPFHGVGRPKGLELVEYEWTGTEAIFTYERNGVTWGPYAQHAPLPTPSPDQAREGYFANLKIWLRAEGLMP